MEGRKFSTSRNWAVWLPDYLERYDPDPLRYILSVNMPETGDTDFSWREFVRRNNDELVATYGNLVHRVLSFTYRNFNGHIPPLGELDISDNALLSKTKDTLNAVGEPLSNCHFKEAIKAAFSWHRQPTVILMRRPHGKRSSRIETRRHRPSEWHWELFPAFGRRCIPSCPSAQRSFTAFSALAEALRMSAGISLSR